MQQKKQQEPPRKPFDLQKKLSELKENDAEIQKIEAEQQERETQQQEREVRQREVKQNYMMDPEKSKGTMLFIQMLSNQKRT